MGIYVHRQEFFFFFFQMHYKVMDYSLSLTVQDVPPV